MVEDRVVVAGIWPIQAAAGSTPQAEWLQKGSMKSQAEVNAKIEMCTSARATSWGRRPSVISMNGAIRQQHDRWERDTRCAESSVPPCWLCSAPVGLSAV